MIRRGIERAAPVLQPVRRSRLVEESTRFLIADLFRLRGCGVYGLAQHDQRVVIRHGGYEDAFILDEIFGPTRIYDPPPRAATHLSDIRRIVDLGANIGRASVRLLARFPACHLLAVEPDAANSRLLETNLALNAMLARATIVHAAAGAEDGRVIFAGGLGGSSHIAVGSEAGLEIPKVDVLPELGTAELLKLDIEGGEWEILLDPRFSESGVKGLCLEYHERLCPAKSPRSLVKETLAGAGFSVLAIHGTEHVGTVWAIR